MTDPAQESAPAETIPPMRRSLLRQHLAATDEVCPRCRYSLRGLDSEACPECGMALRLTVAASQPRALLWVLALIFLWLLAAGAMNCWRARQDLGDLVNYDRRISLIRSYETPGFALSSAPSAGDWARALGPLALWSALSLAGLVGLIMVVRTRRHAAAPGQRVVLLAWIAFIAYFSYHIYYFVRYSL